jgi:nucleoid DNA-binding protein
MQRKQPALPDELLTAEQAVVSVGAKGNAPTKGLLVTKKDMANTIAEEMKLTQIVVKEIMQRLFDGIIDTLEKERRNFGVFEVKQRQPRKARNPRTGESLMVPAKKVVTFKPGLEMEEKVKKATATEATHEKNMHQMQEREKRNGLSAHQGSWTNAASILVRQLHEGIL